MPTWKDIKEFFQDLAKEGLLKWFVIVVITILLGLHLYKNAKGQHSKFLWGLSEVNDISEKIYIHDTLPPQKVYVHDTVPRVLTVRSRVKKEGFNPKTKMDLKIDSGSSGVQVATIKGGMVAGRDINIQAEHHLQESDKKLILTRLSEMQRVYPECGNRVSIFTDSNSNGAKFSQELELFLLQNGYTIAAKGQDMGSGSTNLGYSINVDPDKKLGFAIHIGVL